MTSYQLKNNSRLLLFIDTAEVLKEPISYKFLIYDPITSYSNNYYTILKTEPILEPYMKNIDEHLIFEENHSL